MNLMSISSRENKAEENTQKLVESLGKLGDIKAQISSLTAEIKSIDDRISDEILEKEKLESAITQTKQSLEASVKNIQELTDSRNVALEKQRLEKQNNIKLVRISYKDFNNIEKIICKELNLI